MTGGVERHHIAPLWKRWLAAQIDGLPFAAVALPFILSRRRDGSGKPGWALSLAVRAADGIYQVAMTAKFGRTVGQMAAGIRVVDRRTAAPPRWRQSLLRWALTSLPSALLTLLPVSGKEEQSAAEIERLRPAIQDLRQRHAGNRRRLNEALMALYESHNVDPLRGCLPSLLRVLPALVYNGILHGPALLGPLHQGLHDRASRTVVIDDGPVFDA